MTYREFNNKWLASDSSMAEHTRKKDWNCPYIENLIYRPSDILYSGELDRENFRNWDDEISEQDKAYLTKKVSKKFIATLKW